MIRLISVLIFGFAVPMFAQEQKELIEDATRSAAKEVGRIIGRQIGQDFVQKMTKEDRFALLDRERAALRGALLSQYAFQSSAYRNQLRGYIMVTREGRARLGHDCRELYMYLILDFKRHYELSSACLIEEGNWQLTPAEEIMFLPRAASGPVLTPPPHQGGWLPPIRPK